MNTIRTEKLSARDFITIGIFAAINLVIFFVVGAAAGLTLILAGKTCESHHAARMYESQRIGR